MNVRENCLSLSARKLMLNVFQTHASDKRRKQNTHAHLLLIKVDKIEYCC